MEYQLPSEQFASVGKHESSDSSATKVAHSQRLRVVGRVVQRLLDLLRRYMVRLLIRLRLYRSQREHDVRGRFGQSDNTRSGPSVKLNSVHDGGRCDRGIWQSDNCRCKIDGCDRGSCWDSCSCCQSCLRLLVSHEQLVEGSAPAFYFALKQNRVGLARQGSGAVPAPLAVPNSAVFVRMVFAKGFTIEAVTPATPLLSGALFHQRFITLGCVG